MLFKFSAIGRKPPDTGSKMNSPGGAKVSSLSPRWG
jgi:hypothetical protein